MLIEKSNVVIFDENRNHIGIRIRSSKNSLNFTSIDICAMKLFRLIQIYFRMLGIHSPKQNHVYSMNALNLLIICVLTQGFLLTASFCLLKAKSVREYGDSYYTCTTSFSHSIYTAIHIWKMPKISKLIERFESLIAESKMNLILFKWFVMTHE